MYGDAERTREVEETLAYLAARTDDDYDDEDTGRSPSVGLDDLDNLLLADGESEEGAPPAPLDDLEAALVAEPGPAADSHPRAAQEASHAQVFGEHGS